MAIGAVVRIGRQELQAPRVIFAFNLVDYALMGVDQRRSSESKSRPTVVRLR